jgi:prevent-host-death family protein
VKQVKISEAKNNLSRYLAYVARGGRVRILDRDVPVADLVPVEPTGDEDVDPELANLARCGLLRPGEAGPLDKLLFQPGPRGKKGARAGSRVLDALLLDRRDGR